MTTPRQLLASAADCYMRAGSLRDGARCLVAIEDHHAAGRLYERASEPGMAAECFERAGDFLAAARCHQAAGDASRAIDCFVRADRALDAGWLACDEGHMVRARRILRGADARTRAETMRRELGLARCEVAGPRRSAALERAIHDVESRIASEPRGVASELEQWAVQAADAEGRFDLSSRVFAAACTVGDPGAEARWRAWALRVLGDATGVGGAPAASERRRGEP